ncbi:hypothetical protein GCM10022287_08790 [Gryllotalpicola koreensis]|uniref:Ornithine cyclodeaminase family protein n=1 Tax=Gryllotalpicola koreensis TaxID=993086 RepID=A0ABP7ZUC6_9MICO
MFVDHLETALHESGDILIPISEGAFRQSNLAATLGEVLAETHPGRTNDDAVTVFDAVGTGIQDLAVASFFVNAARAAGTGIDFPFFA